MREEAILPPLEGYGRASFAINAKTALDFRRYFVTLVSKIQNCQENFLMAVNASLDEEPDDKKKADGDAPAAEGEAAAEGGGKLNAKKILLFVVVPLFLLIGAGGGLYFTGTLDKILHKGGEETEASAEAGAEGEHGKADAHGKEAKGKKAKGGHGEAVEGNGPFFLEIPNMLVNLSGTDNQQRYLRLSVQLELSSQADLDAVKAVMPRVVDQFQTYLRELRVKDLRGSAGMYRLQTELLARVNAAAYPVEVKDVLFQEILIQ